MAVKKGKQIDTYVSRYVVFDFETTGISAEKDDIIEISAIKVENGIIVDEFSTLVNPLRPIPSGASAVNGITDQMVAKAPTVSQIWPEFLDFLGDYTLVGHNIHNFDMKFLYRESSRLLGRSVTNDYADTLPMARMVLPELSHHRLTDLAAYYKISSKGAHRALNDCRMNQQVYEKLARQLDQAKVSGRIQIKKCPRCGMQMRKRKGKFGEFWGCGGYPNCKYTENL